MNEDQLREALARGEQRHVEFKGGGALTDADYRARVIRAVLGMTNRRDGGTIILGVDDRDPVSSPGMTEAEVSAWTDFDDVADQIAKYADPGVEFTTRSVAIDGATFVVLDVEEFREVPVICKREFDKPGGEKVLRRGAVYVRPHDGKVETREVANVNEMRALIDLASEKRLRAHIEMTARAGGVIAPSDQPGRTPEALFAAELGDLA